MWSIEGVDVEALPLDELSVDVRPPPPQLLRRSLLRARRSPRLFPGVPLLHLVESGVHLLETLIVVVEHAIGLGRLLTLRQLLLDNDLAQNLCQGFFIHAVVLLDLVDRRALVVTGLGAGVASPSVALCFA